MFGKYFKWKLKEYFRTMWPLLAACLIVELVMLISNTAGVLGRLSTISILIYGAVMNALMVMIAVKIVQNYWKDTYGRDAHFMMSLPVSSDTRMLAHACASFILILAALVVSVLPFICLMVRYGMPEYNGLRMAWNAEEVKYAVVFVITVIAGIFSTLFQIYFSEGIGALVPNYAVPIGIAVFVATGLLEGKILSLINYEVSFNISVSTIGGNYFMQKNGGMGVLVAILIITLIEAAIFYLVERFLLEKHYNLKG
jgi:hypothetical protein